MSTGWVACLGCGRDLPADFENAEDFSACPTCLERVRVFAFSALHRIGAVSAAIPGLAPGDATCFYHAQKQAIVACDSCGRFLCALCDVEIGGSHRCPACLESGKRKRKLEVVENRRVLYDGLALALAVGPILMWPFTILTAPAALFLVVRHWRGPLSILPRSRIRFVLAFLIALAQICGWILLFYFLFAGTTKAGR